MIKIIKATIISGLVAIVGACVSTEGGVFSENAHRTGGQMNTGVVDSLDDLKVAGSRSAVGDNRETISAIRRTALQEAGLSVGAQAGLANRAQRINQQLEAEEAHLSQVFNFNTLLLEENVLPPVLVEGESSLNIEDGNTLRLVNRTYKILKQARFVTTPPHWREYLWQSYQQPKLPDNSLLPKNAAERVVWDSYVTQGWENGVVQANSIFAESLGRLKQDYVGMLIYSRLLAQNMVSAPYVATSELGVTGDSNEINIDDRVLRITALPGLQVDSEQWDPIVSSSEDTVQLDERIEKIASGEPDPDQSDKQWRALISSKAN